MLLRIKQKNAPMKRSVAEKNSKQQQKSILTPLVIASTTSMRTIATTTVILNHSNQTTKAKDKIKTDVDQPNEFSNGNKLGLQETVVIIFILFIWILSLRKLFKNFDKLRSTHYREIPYKHRIQQSHQNHLITDNQNETLTKKLPRSFSYENSKSSLESRELNDTDKFKTNQRKTVDKSSFSSLEDLKNRMNDRNQKAKYSLQERKKFKASRKKYSTNFESNSNLIDPKLLSPLVRKSMLELHRKSIDNIAAATVISTSSISKLPSSSKLDQEKETEKRKGSVYAKKKSNFAIDFKRYMYRKGNIAEDKKKYMDYVESPL